MGAFAYWLQHIDYVSYRRALLDSLGLRSG